MGYYLETLINETVPGNVKVLLSNGETIVVDGSEHQVDHLFQTEDGQIYHLEMKTNLELDRGKKRDVRHREEVITRGLVELIGQPVKSCVFCPLMEDSRSVSGLGDVMGLREFVALFR